MTNRIDHGCAPVRRGVPLFSDEIAPRTEARDCGLLNLIEPGASCVIIGDVLQRSVHM
jgi:hypothetical protein